MLVDVMKHYGLTIPLSQAGYYETLFTQTLDPVPTAELHEKMLAAGLPR